jgi:N-acetylglucosaminyldiphosphoundecaprenol N-acetyl-beta-D-mannosaminyltransferase
MWQTKIQEPQVTDFREIELATARECVLIGGLPFEVTDMDTAVGDVIAVAGAHTSASLTVRLSNAYCVALASKDADYRRLFDGPGLTLPDGAPVAWAMRSRARVPQRTGRVRGPSFFVEVLDRGRASGLRHFMLGATDETLAKLVDEAESRYPGVHVVDTYAPPFGPIEETIDEAAFDFVAGSVKEAPKWVQNSGFEWAYRLCSEPRRLWRRYLFGNARFILAVMRGR